MDEHPATQRRTTLPCFCEAEYPVLQNPRGLYCRPCHLPGVTLFQFLCICFHLALTNKVVSQGFCTHFSILIIPSSLLVIHFYIQSRHFRKTSSVSIVKACYLPCFSAQPSLFGYSIFILMFISSHP